MKKDSDTLKDLAWLITGGCGFIGTNLVATLIKENYTSKIRVLDNLSVGKREDLKRVCNFNEGLSESIENGISDVELLEADIMDYNACLKACEGIDYFLSHDMKKTMNKFNEKQNRKEIDE